VVFSPFLDGLSSLSYFRVPMFLMGEEEGTYSTLMGKRKTKGFLPVGGSLQEFLKSLLDSLPKGGNISRLSEELFPQEGLIISSNVIATAPALCISSIAWSESPGFTSTPFMASTNKKTK
jgi:hypothetical protein